MAMNILATIGIYLILINAGAYQAFAMDKAYARGGHSRISEQTLLLFALVGGSLGAVTAQKVIRHKTKKEPFRTRLAWIFRFHILLVLAIAILYVFGDLVPVVERLKAAFAGA